ncbi:MAG: hypothetical protein IID49_03745 [Proteobacteria bacterium]|nr:hypothetical protein [Pseudomonadota bacterium]
MRLAIALFALIATAGVAPVAVAGCIACPEGYGYWHRKEACVPEIDGFVGTPPASTWVEPLRNQFTGHGEDPSELASGPDADR